MLIGHFSIYRLSRRWSLPTAPRRTCGFPKQLTVFERTVEANKSVYSIHYQMKWSPVVSVGVAFSLSPHFGAQIDTFRMLACNTCWCNLDHGSVYISQCDHVFCASQLSFCLVNLCNFFSASRGQEATSKRCAQARVI